MGAWVQELLDGELLLALLLTLIPLPAEPCRTGPPFPAGPFTCSSPGAVFSLASTPFMFLLISWEVLQPPVLTCAATILQNMTQLPFPPGNSPDPLFLTSLSEKSVCEVKFQKTCVSHCVRVVLLSGHAGQQAS